MHYVTVAHYDGSCGTLCFQSREFAQKEFDAASDNPSVVFARIFAMTDYGRAAINTYAADFAK